MCGGTILTSAMTFTSAFVSGIIREIELVQRGREEFVDRELHFFEQVAGLLVSNRRAFLFRDTEISAGNDYLGGALKSDYFEKAEGNNQILAAVVVTELSSHRIGDVLGYGVAAAAGITSAALIDYLDR